MDGAADGRDVVGIAEEGATEGSKLGVMVGITEGAAVGTTVGAAVGASDGISEGAKDTVGWKLKVGFTVGAVGVAVSVNVGC